MPSRNYDTELDQLKAIQNKNRQKTRIQNSTAKYNKKASNYRGGTGHGVVMFSEAANPAMAGRSGYATPQSETRMRENKQVLDDLDKDIAAEKKKNKNAKKEMNEARRQLVGQRIADGKAHGVILYDARSKAYYKNGERLTPAQVKKAIAEADEGKSTRARTLDSKVKADVVYPRNPTEEMFDDYMANRGRTDMVGVDAPKGTRSNVKVGTSPGTVKKKATQKRKSTQTATKKTPAKVEKEMIGSAGGSRWVVTEQGRTYVGDKWGNYDNAAMMTSVRGTPRYEGPYTRETCNGHRIRKVYYDPMTGRFNVLATKSGVKGTIIGRDYDPVRGFWQGGTYDRSADYIRNFVDGMRLVADYGTGSASCRSGRR